jgi:hypothetical protein
MRCKIRFVSRQANGGVSFKEQAVEVQGRG